MSIIDLGKRLLESAKHGDSQEVQLLVTNGAPFTTDWLGASPLHMAAQYGHLETAEVLLRAGISRDARTKVDRTPLHVAAQEGYVDIVELLLRHGAEIEARDMLFMTPLHWAVERSHIDVIYSLLHNDANTKACSKFLKTPVDIAEDNCRLDIVQMLRDHVSNPPKKIRTEKTPPKKLPIVRQPPIQPKPPSTVLPLNVIQSEPLLKIKNAKTEALKNRMPGLITVANVPVVPSSSARPRPVLIRTSLGGIKTTTLPSANSNNNINSADSSVDGETTEQKCTNVLATLAALAEATAPNSSISTQEAMKWLELHGITMLPSDNSTIVASALEGGQTVSLTEAGKLALTWIKEQKNLSDTIVTTNDLTTAGSPNLITFVTNKAHVPSIVTTQSTPIVIVKEPETIEMRTSISNKTDNVPDVQEKERLLIMELEKMKKQAENYKAQLLIKEHEAEQYRKQLQQLKESTQQNQ